MNKFIFLAAIVILFSGCVEEWEQHYNTPPETVNKNMWEVIKANDSLRLYVEYIEELGYDTLFEKNSTYTLFIPTNQAIEDFIIDDSITASVWDYHISTHYIQSGNIIGAEKVQMIAEKYVLFEHFNNTLLFDGVPIDFESPLYLNGKYFVMNQVATPRPNLFEYFSYSNPILKTYILNLDSIILDKEKSRPIGFDEEGNTVYDTVSVIYNEFEEEYFPVREEYRNKTATVIFPKAEDYNAALDVMAETLGDLYQDYRDIPLDWQNDILIPYLLEHGIFENSLTESDFIQTGRDSLKLKNILGDSIVIEYKVTDKVICSNGVTFNYEDFAIPDTLYKGSVRVEAEWFVEETGTNKYTWREELASVSGKTFNVYADSIPTASNDSILRVILDPNFTGNYTVKMKIKNLFPRKYLMVVRSHKNFGGRYRILLNGNELRIMDYHDYFEASARWFYPSVIPGERYFYDQSTPGYVHWDALANNERDYGEAELTFEYLGPSEMVPTTALLIDYIDFIPYDY